jgi:hypothetical protein
MSNAISNGQGGQPLPKLEVADLAAVRARIGLPPAAAAQLAGCVGAAEALERLAEGGFLIEATRLVAHALPRREAVWWACMCARHTAPGDLPETDLAAVDLAETWVRKQTDDVRRTAMEQAQRTGFGSPEAWAAVAAFWSGDSLTPADQAKVPPAPHLAGTAVAGAVALAAVRIDPARTDARLARFLDSAREIAQGGVGRLEPEGA